MKLSFEELKAELTRAFIALGFEQERAILCAHLFTQTTCDGVYSHGVNRFPRFVHSIKTGLVKVNSVPEKVSGFAALERWDGRQGPGNLNAFAAMSRAMNLSEQYGIGCVSLRNTNHWMRGGTYGWQAAEGGCIAICWTNTMPNLPPWGSTVPTVGNNPLIFAVPYNRGHVILDMAMSQFSYGALANYQQRNESLPVDGGFDDKGNLTRDPAAIELSKRPLPIGYWKGSGLAVILDMVAAILAMGNATHQLSGDVLQESALSQTFIAIRPRALGDDTQVEQILDGIIESLHRSPGDQTGSQARYPGERTLKIRQDNLSHGIPVSDEIWKKIQAVANAGNDA